MTQDRNALLKELGLARQTIYTGEKLKAKLMPTLQELEDHGFQDLIRAINVTGRELYPQLESSVPIHL